MRWFSLGSSTGHTDIHKRRVAREGIVFVADDGQKWNVCVYRRSSVGAWWSEEQRDWSRKLVVVFEGDGEHRVAVTDWEDDWDSPRGLSQLFTSAAERRSGQDRRNEGVFVPSDRRGDPDRRTQN
jgi:hypothetical protein